MGHSDAILQPAEYEQAEKQFVSGHPKDAFPLISQFAEQGNLKAQYILACFCHMGFDTVQIDYARRNRLCAQAEAQNDPFLLYGYAVWCLKKDQKEQRDKILKEIFDRLLTKAYSSDLLAQYIVGKMHIDGNAVEQDYATAAKWFKAGAESGYAAAQNALGWLYGESKGVPQDTAKAFELYLAAAEQGYANEQINLGIVYAEGLGVPQNDEKAIAWYQKAAMQGYAPALLNLGWHYDNGRGVEKDTQKALEYYQKAAKKGNTTAMYNLVNLYRKGVGTEKSPEQAAEWYLKALQQQYNKVSETYEEILAELLVLDDDTVIWPD